MATPLYLRNEIDPADWQAMFQQTLNPNLQTVQNQAASIAPRQESQNPLLSEIPVTNNRDPYLQSATQVDRAKLGKYMNSLEQLINERQGRIGELKSMPQGIDFTALGALADQMNGGGNMTSAMKAIAPMSKDERAKMAISLEQQLAGDTQGLAGLQASILRSDQDALARSVDQKNQRGMMNLYDRQYDKVAQPVMKLGAEYQDRMGSISKIEQTLNDPKATPADLKVILSDLAKGIGRDTGALSNQDLNRYEIPSLMSQIDQQVSYLTGERSGKIPANTRTTLNNLLAKAKNISREVHRLQLDNVKQSYMPKIRGTPVESQVNELLDSHYKNVIAPPKKSLEELARGL